MQFIPNPLWVPIPIAPKEILLTRGPFSGTYVRVVFDDPTHAQELIARFVNGEEWSDESWAQWLEQAGCTEPRRELERWLSLGILTPAGAPCVRWIAGNGLQSQYEGCILCADDGPLGHILLEDLQDFGFDIGSLISPQELLRGQPKRSQTLVVLCLNEWSPQWIAEVERYSRVADWSILPIFLVADGGVIGPLTRKGLPGYRSFERQWEARMSLWFAWRAWRAMTHDKQARPLFPRWPKAFIEWFGHLASILVGHVLCGDERPLLARCVLVDFASIFIESSRVYLHPVECNAGTPRMEF